MKKRLQMLLGATFFGLLFIYTGASLVQVIGLLRMGSNPGWYPYQIGNRPVIVEVDKDETMPLRVGDEIIAINGQPLRYAFNFTRVFRDTPPDQPYTITIRRGGQMMQFTLQTRAIPLVNWTLMGSRGLIIPSIFLLVGVAVFLLKPYDKQALLLALMFGMFLGALSATAPAFEDAQWWLLGVMLTVQIVSLFLWPVFFHFFLTFPEPSPLLRRFPKLELYLYAPHLLTIFPYFATLNVLNAVSPDQMIAYVDRTRPLRLISLVLCVSYIAAGLLTLLINYREAGLASRRKMRVVVAGTIAGFLPIFLVIGLAFVFNLPETSPTLARWLASIAMFSFPLFPLSFAYSIIRHQVIPARILLRRSARYLLISRGFVFVQALVVFALLSFLLTGSRMAAIDRLGARADIVVTMLITAFSIGLLTLLNQRVMPLIDRKFFREAYDAQQVLSELGRELRTVSAIPQVLEKTVARVQNALHAENVTVFLLDRTTGNYRCAISSYMSEDGASSSDIDRTLRIPPDGIVVERLKRAAHPLVLDFDESDSWMHELIVTELVPGESRKREVQTLRRVRSALLIPVSTSDELIAIVSLGRRLGDLPFSYDDKQLLMTVSGQMAFALHNAELIRVITEEEMLRHEVEIAATVQRRLFPECPPEMNCLELAGVCHPARGVGGDYYDFILLEQGKIGIAVADVAGKGISAALLMSTVQASLRSQAPTVNGKLTDLVSAMNRLLHVSTDANSYATFFFAQFAEETGLLTYVNAGHNPPMLLRAAPATRAKAATASTDEGELIDGDSQIGYLTTGGPVIGALANCAYEQEAIQMNSGDTLVAYTDGVTEALNADGVEFGEPRLKKILSASAHLSARELTEKIVSSVREWCGDTPQHDDLTLVVMRVK
jgi:sigma-B regulation protein RsbU (phosphoserine phosphatase)